MLRRVLHLGVYAFQTLRRGAWFVTRPRTHGVHAIPLTPEGKVVLVTLSYAKGWRLPGGGRKADEDPVAAILRELREEIGLEAYDSIESVCDFEHRPDFRHGQATLFIVRGVRFQPRWSLEIKHVDIFDPGALPPRTAAVTHRLLGLAKLD